MSARSATVAYIGLGSNLNDPLRHVCLALRALRKLPHSTLLGHSSLYRSNPLGPVEQPDYINAVAALETRLRPRQLLASLQRLEQQQGRGGGAGRWGPRILDLDILLYGDLELYEPGLIIPHPGLSQRNFVLYPLSEIRPDLVIPGHGPLSALIDSVPATGLIRLDHSCVSEHLAK